ncbi:hypothetical protein K501DRAFT_330572 [Backusella circina FSU 941]|nr:hypothetical protein K501DRAFT_330572 [Backusella circina FSU 941]
MSRPNPLYIENLMCILFVLISISYLLCYCLLKAVGGLVDVCSAVVVPLVLDFFAWEGASNSFDSPSDSNFEAGPSSNTPEATPVGTSGTPLLRQEDVRLVGHICTPPFGLAVDGRSHYSEACQSCRERLAVATLWPGLIRSAAVTGRDTVSDGVSVVDDAQVVSEAPVSVVTDSDEVRGNAEVNLQVEAAPAVEAYVPEATPSTENYWAAIQVDLSCGERMEIDPWWWKGAVLFEYVPEMMDIDVQVEGGLGGVDLDQPAQMMGASFSQMQEHSDRVACEDILMADPLPSEVGEPMFQDHMELEAHLNSDVESDLFLAESMMTEASSFEGDRPVISDASPETSEEGDVVLNRGPSEDLPTLPSTEVLEDNLEVLTQSPVQDQDFSEGRSGSAASPPRVEQHPADCECATCATVTRDLEEVRDVFRLFEEEEEQEEAQEEARVSMNRTIATTKTNYCYKWFLVPSRLSQLITTLNHCFITALLGHFRKSTRQCFKSSSMEIPNAQFKVILLQNEVAEEMIRNLQD